MLYLILEIENKTIYGVNQIHNNIQNHASSDM